MRGVVIHAPRDLRIEEVPIVPPAPLEVRVRIEAGGICGSDLHYYRHGGFGTVRIREPMALGHEVAGVIEEVGAGVSHLVPGMRVAVNPSRPCNACRFCLGGQRNQCLDMRFLGSAMRFPHVQGGFRQSLTVDAAQAVPLSDTLSMAEAAMAEPLAVCLHAASRAGNLLGARVLITGCGPIGALAALVARHAGAAEIIVTDVAAAPLVVAERLGITRAVNVAEEPEALSVYARDKGTIDVLFEASGSAAALAGALDVMRPGGVIVQLGLGGDGALPINVLVAKELQLRGTFRFDREFELAVALLGGGAIDVKPLLTAILPFERATEAFELASDRNQAMKVQLAF
ncbi:L-idonate 5-dehydrogenase [Chelatococcus composti]|uniref:L-idonate 5-dehydrogenase n=1 Tax=Chelatococcus composti TaxID=1743235 RepID=UPI000DB75B56|nr:L-idonate 5-dehydrogenase [Chelatococcus composti]MBS7737299.1 L-idonate 5-dehydrogenase [Chelatococcus composti]PZN44350.1 MAG: L-idonate 5-dehydrogenase [Pseudomonadota bacterium]